MYGMGFLVNRSGGAYCVHATQETPMVYPNLFFSMGAVGCNNIFMFYYYMFH